MNQAAPPAADHGVFERNLAALRSVDGALADRLAAAAATLAAFTPARTRDGQLSFACAAGGGPRWFGRSSIPAVRAEALLAKFDPGLGNVLLPGVGQGIEATWLLDRLGPHRAVFVWETDEACLAPALRLHEWSGAIAAGRLVLLPCAVEQLGDTLAAWLAGHPGHLCPERILMWPWLTVAELAACRSAVQMAYHDTEQRRAEELSRERAADAGSSLAGEPAGPSAAFSHGPVAVLTLHVRDELAVLGESLVKAAHAIGVPAAAVLTRGPDDVHPLGRLLKLRRSIGGRPRAAILLDCSRRQVRDLCPDATRVVSWVGPHAPDAGPLAAGAAPGDTIVTTSSRLSDRIVAAGWSGPRPAVVPWPCLAEPADGQATADRPIDVLILADAAPVVPSRFGLTLQSHLQIWQTASELLEARIGTFHEDQAAGVWEQAERKLGFRLDDAALRSSAIEALAVSAGQRLLWMSLAQVLIQKEVRITILGRGWEGPAAARVAGSLGTITQQADALRRAKLVVWADVRGEVDGLPLLAAGCGAVLVARRHPRDSQPGGLATLLAAGTEYVAFGQSGEVVSAIRPLLASTARREAIVRAAGDRCRSEHGPHARLAALARAAGEAPGSSSVQS